MKKEVVRRGKRGRSYLQVKYVVSHIQLCVTSVILDIDFCHIRFKSLAMKASLLDS